MVQHSVMAGTAKGLVIFSFTNSSLTKTEVLFKGLPVSMVYVDERTNTWWVGLSHKHWGEKLHYSDDQGATWKAGGVPSYKGFEYRPGRPATLHKIWVMQHAGPDKLNGLWLGTEPGGLFYSGDGGHTFQLNTGLWNHPSRMDDNQWFGTGNDFPFIHSIVTDPRDGNHIYVGVSCAGVFETTDGGENWSPCNNGLVAAYLPRTEPEIGHDPHQMLQCRSNPDVIWQQNHCGIFRTSNGGKEWMDVSGTGGWPSYGFALAIDHRDSDKAWVIPAESDGMRIPVGLKLQVCKTVDGGKSWISSSKGLPQENSFDLVLRHSFVRQENLMVFGTTNGNLYCSFDDGESWSVLSHNLAPVFTLGISVSGD